MTITLDLTESQHRMLSESAAHSGISPESYATEALLYRMEEERDMRVAEAAYVEWLGNPEVIDHEDLAAELGLR